MVTFDAEDDHRYKILEEEEGQRVCHPGLALDLVCDSHTVLSFLSALSSRGRDTRPTAEDKLPARAAPQTWPRPT